MYVNDPIADMLTRIRNGLVAKKNVVEVPTSKMLRSIADILVEQGYIKNAKTLKNNTQGTLRMTMKYSREGEKTVMGLKRISSPGLRVYAKKDDIPKVLGGLGIAIISTSKGVITDKKARELNVGGEVLAFVW